ncbi:MAG: hypothetical protein LBF27_03370 [Sphingobacterium sp.]|jgi:hypothetical protein|nr:hypothetical protein [Sphingobacterium sp.]
MKNAFKLGFLGLALTLAFASCGETSKKAEGAADSAANKIDSAANTLDSAANKVDSAAQKVDSAANHAH